MAPNRAPKAIPDAVPAARPDDRGDNAAKRSIAVLVLAALLASAGWALLPSGLAGRAFLAAGATLALTSVMLGLRAWVARRAETLAAAHLAQFIARDAAPSIVANSDGAILTRNAAASERFAETASDTLGGTLRAVFANPQAAIFRLQGRAVIEGSAREDIATRRGHVRLSVHRLAQDEYLWRIEDVADRAHGGRSGDAMPVPMVTVGRSGVLLFMNDAARNLIGERTKTLDKLFPELPLRLGQVNQLATCKGPVGAVVTGIDGPAGRRELFFLPVGDIGKADRGVFGSVPVPVIKVAPDGQILAVNHLAEDLLGVEITREMKLSSVMDGLGRPVNDWLRETAEGHSSHKSEFLRLTRPDKEVFVQVTLNRATEDGKPVLIAVLNDATELKTLEAQFVQSQKMQAIGQLAGGVAHDFNNLLTAISGHCDLLLLRHDQGDQDYGDLVQIHQNANRAAALISQLLAFSRKQTLRPQVVDLRDTLSDLTHLLNRLVGEKVTLTLSHDPVLKPIRADKRQLEQVLMNLVVNARDAMPEGGEIRIETEVVALAETLNRDRATVPPGEYVTVRVADQGIGIPPDKLQKVFEPFFTTKRTGEGTGLGLSTAYGIVKQSGGFIFVDSEPGQGTEFVLYFPVHESETATAAPAEAKPGPEPQAAPRKSEGVVLLVEDEAPVRAFASRALRLRGFTVLEAESAEEALRMLEEPDLHVDVFVTDVVMPGMNGPSWVREAQKTRPDVRVVFVSGYAEGAFGEQEDPPVPNSVFLPKPFSLSQLTETVQEQLA